MDTLLSKGRKHWWVMDSKSSFTTTFTDILACVKTVTTSSYVKCWFRWFPLHLRSFLKSYSKRGKWWFTVSKFFYNNQRVFKRIATPRQILPTNVRLHFAFAFWKFNIFLKIKSRLVKFLFLPICCICFAIYWLNSRQGTGDFKIAELIRLLKQ